MEAARRQAGLPGRLEDLHAATAPRPASSQGGDAGETTGSSSSTASLQARLELAQQIGSMVTWEHHPHGDVVLWSEPVEGLFGPHADASGFRFVSPGDDDGEDAVIADLAVALLDPVLTVVRAGAPWEQYEVTRRVQSPEGTFHTVTVRAVPVEMTDGPDCVGVVAVNSDARDVEVALQDIIDRYRLLTDLSPVGIIVHHGGIAVYGNPAALAMLKSTLGDGVGRPVADFIHPDSLPGVMSRISTLQHPGDVSEPAEVTLVGSDGSTTFVETTSVLTTWDGQPAYQVILHDITERRRAEAAVRYQASLVAHVSDAIIGIDREGRIESWNPAAEAIYGWTVEEAVGQPVTRLLTGGRERGTVLEGGERVHVRKDGQLIEVRVSQSPLSDQAGTPSGWVTVCTEITEIRRAEAARRAAEERYAAVVAAMEEGIVVVDAYGRLSAANHAAERILGSRIETGVGDSLFAPGQIATREDGLAFPPSELPVAATLRSGQAQSNLVMGVIDDDGHPQWLSVGTRLLGHSPRTGTHAVVCTFSDITDRKSAEAQLDWQASHDHLTGLANRSRFLDRIERALLAARHNQSTVAVLFIDIDRFKMVNDSLGHNAGDEVLIALGRRLEAAVRGGDIVGRLAGDEFAVLCRDISNVEASVNLANALSEVISQPLTVSGDREVVVTASIGVAFVEKGNREAQELLQDADVAMYRAKEKGRERVEVFDEVLRRRAQARLEVREDLRAAIAHDGLSVHYQPLASVSDGHIVGMEALVRWEHPTRGLLPPLEFIPLAEETGLILSLGGWVLRRACMTMAGWRRTRNDARNAYVTVNLSPRQLTDPDLPSSIQAALDESGLAPRALVLEVTESALMADSAAAGAMLAEIRSMGVRLAIDDFGTGYSSLAHLKRFSVDFLKIDRAFVDGLGEAGDDAAIVTAVVELGHSLDLSVLAEGVETNQQLNEVRRLGCDLYQGYLLARPAPPEKIDFSLGSPGPGPRLLPA